MMKNLAFGLALGLATTLSAGVVQAETFDEITGSWAITSINNKGQGPKMRCVMTLKGVPEATGDGFRLFALSDFYMKRGNEPLAERAAVSVTLGPKALGTENAAIEGVTVSTAPGGWSVPTTARWVSRVVSGSLTLVVRAPLKEIAHQVAKGDALRVNIPAGKATDRALSIAIPLRGSSKALRTFDRCRKASR